VLASAPAAAARHGTHVGVLFALFTVGIRAGITAAAWHVDTTFFASADANGTVVLWKKKTAVPAHRKRPSFDLGRMPSVDKK
jgi:hypothetical protein